jgi:magnesium-protoporphyrin O-methyltransferase
LSDVVMQDAGPDAGAGAAYVERRAWLTEYFDRTAATTWARLTSDAPVSGIRRTVRAGRDRMRDTLLGWLPSDLTGARVLDAGCGTGAASLALARRGADVLAVDLSPTLVALAAERVASDPASERIVFRSGDMLDEAFGRFDYVVAMDSLIHYDTRDAAAALGALASRTRHAIVVTFAPRTPALSVMHAVGRLLPRGDRAPRIEPVAARTLARQALALPALDQWAFARSERISSGFYVSQAYELVRGRPAGSSR